MKRWTSTRAASLSSVVFIYKIHEYLFRYLSSNEEMDKYKSSISQLCLKMKKVTSSSLCASGLTFLFALRQLEFQEFAVLLLKK
jgi:hypothetical protein